MKSLWQVRGIWSQQLKHKQVPQRGTEPGVRKGKNSLLASHTRCKCSMENILIHLDICKYINTDLIEEHVKDTKYCSTEAATKAKTILDKHQTLVVMGITGSGKTKTALEVVKNWQDEQKSKKRHCVIVNSITEVQKKNEKCLCGIRRLLFSMDFGETRKFIVGIPC